MDLAPDRVDCRGAHLTIGVIVVIRLACSLLAAIASLSLLAGRVTASTEPEPSGWAVVLLLDRSPSVASKPVDEYAVQIRDRIVGWARFQDVPLYFASANFGRRIGESTLPLVKVTLANTPALPKRETISYTDFRVALNCALQAYSDAGRPGRLLVILVTDAEPWPSGSRMTTHQKEQYFQRIAPLGKNWSASLAGAIGKLQEERGDIIVVATGDLPDDARIWRSYIPQSHYISAMETPDPMGEMRNVLLSLAYEGTPALTHSPQEGDKIQVVREPEDVQLGRNSRWLWMAAVAGALLLALTIMAIRYPNWLPPDLRGYVHWRKANQYLLRNNTAKAERELQFALRETVNGTSRRSTWGIERVARIQRKMLEKVYLNQPAKQIQFLRSQLSGGATRFQVAALARVLLSRWKADVSTMINEFYDLQATASGGQLVEELKQATALDEGEEPVIKTLRRIAEGASQLRMLAGEL